MFSRYFCIMPKIKSLVPLLLLLLMFACNTSNDKTSVLDSNSSTKKINNADAYPPNVIALFADVKQHPDSTGRRLQLAFALDSIGAFAEALKQMDTLIKKDSLNYGLWFKKGEIAEDAKDTDRAMMSYARAIGIYPSPDALLSLANLYSEQKNKKALDICRQVQQMSLGREFDAHCAFITGVYYARTHNKEKALESFDNCIANDYTYMDAYIEKGLVYFDNKQYEDALRIFQFASTVNALDSNPYYWEGRCYEMMGVKDSAVLRLKQSLHLEEDSATHAALKRLGAE
jgi:tetratricopeptide (TPR) repeat protein